MVGGGGGVSRNARAEDERSQWAAGQTEASPASGPWVNELGVSSGPSPELSLGSVIPAS